MPSRPLFAACLLSLSACYTQPDCECQTAPPWPSSAAAAVAPEACGEPVAVSEAPSTVATHGVHGAAAQHVPFGSQTLAAVAGGGFDVSALDAAPSKVAAEAVPRKRAPAEKAAAAQGAPAGVVPKTAARKASGTADLSVSTRVRNGLSNDQIRDVAVASMGQVRACYERALKSAPTLRGRMVVSWKVARSGDVTRARVKEDSLGNDALQGCIVDAVRGWSFPEADATTSVSFPFVLKPG